MKKIIMKKDTIVAMPSVTKVAAYARVSSGKDEMLHSLAAQVSHYSGYIQRQPGWLYIGVYADEAATGTKDNRPEFKRLLADCRGGGIDLVLTKSISRFARNTVDLLETVRDLKSIGVDVFFEKQNLHTMSGDGELMLTILASYAQEESRSASENCKWRIRKRFENGELANLRFMFGYLIDKGKVELDPEQTNIVQMIFEDYIGGLGGGKLAAKLKSMNVPRPFGGEWTAERVMGIIKNEKYTGNALLQKKYVVDHLSKKLVHNNGQLPQYYAECTHPAIIDQETFDKAQAILNSRRLKSKTKSSTCSRYPFSSLLQCEICGKKYKRKDRKGKVAWYCSTFLQKGKTACPSKQVPESVLYSLSTEVLGLEEFSAEVFRKEISEIFVPEPGKLIFVFHNGRTVEKLWQHKSRSESWTEEMRETARNYAKRRH
ncbi:MAG: recombinase family protein [Sedimentisphaerales bacterium]|nr:recombinase family protein [Sedimentisphaerales bacterium]